MHLLIINVEKVAKISNSNRKSVRLKLIEQKKQMKRAVKWAKNVIINVNHHKKFFFNRFLMFFLFYDLLNKKKIKKYIILWIFNWKLNEWK